MKKSKIVSAVLFLFTVMLFGAFAASTADAAPKGKEVILATTTSTQDSGLLDVLLPVFKRDTGYFVKTISVGSGQAMMMGKRGEADVLLVHSPAEEKKLADEGYFIDRKLVMHNDFIIVGPAGDPAKIKGSKTAAEAFRKIAQSRALFYSRADKSGTHTKELGIWKAAGINPEGQKWYMKTGTGMGGTLNVAGEKDGYTLADRGTYIALNKKNRLSSIILLQGEPGLLNIYHVMVVNPAKWPQVNVAGAKAFDNFMVSQKAQELIRTYGVKKYGSPLFFPDAGKNPKDLGL
ncbi:MAG TPA: substrate-binding domain-containing protein [Geobacteraceae bacterium]|nr:substrate-binding domain-containing protein [Geobacteraceae bacterium]